MKKNFYLNEIVFKFAKTQIKKNHNNSNQTRVNSFDKYQELRDFIWTNKSELPPNDPEYLSQPLINENVKNDYNFFEKYLFEFYEIFREPGEFLLIFNFI